MQKWLAQENYSGQPVSYRGTTIIPFSRVLRIQIPGISGGLIWNRPVSVLTVDADGQERLFPVRDITRQVVWGLLGLTFLVGLFTLGKRRVC
jgi:hypothetical protein